MPGVTLQFRIFQTATSLQAFVNGNYNAFPQGPALSPNDNSATVNNIVSITFDASSGQYVLWFT